MSSQVASRWALMIVAVATGALGANGVARAADGPSELSVLSENGGADALRSLLLRDAGEALDRRLSAFEHLRTAEQVRSYQDRLLSVFRDSLGAFPPRTPLEARVVGRQAGDGFLLEKVIYQSRPHFFVTASLYLPHGNPPFPAVLFPCGHSELGKSEEAYQRACALLARNGIAALCYDPIGQGERKQILARDSQGTSTLTGRFRATSEHMLAGVAPILLGENLATYRIWDGIRGLDYLQSRQEINGELLACAGNSGGGLMTSYLMALDPRIRAAAPSCFITTTRRKNVSPGPGDAEQNLFGQIDAGLDHPDYLILRAPRPTLICAATRDFVPIEGTWEAMRQAKRIYGRLGFSERVDLVEADETHGFSHPLRVAMVRFMRRWLLDETGPLNLRPFAISAPAELQCSPHGQVLAMDGAVSVFDLYQQAATKLVAKRRGLARPSVEMARQEIRRVSRIPPLNRVAPPRVERRGRIDREHYTIEKLVLRSVDRVPLPALLFEPKAEPRNERRELTVFLHPDGKQMEAQPGGSIDRLVLAGGSVLAVDLTGFGETASQPRRYNAVTSYMGVNAVEYFVAYMLGRSLVSIRAEDIFIVLRFLENERPDARPVKVMAVGSASVPALHAAALEPDRISQLRLVGPLESWERVIREPLAINQLESTIHGALQSYDLPDLVRVYGKERVSVAQWVDARGNSIER